MLIIIFGGGREGGKEGSLIIIYLGSRWVGGRKEVLIIIFWGGSERGKEGSLIIIDIFHLAHGSALFFSNLLFIFLFCGFFWNS